jgi:glycosyltransferase involved in cell wall biosynthesis
MKQTISILVPMYNESGVITPFFEHLLPILDSLEVEWEVICVDDGSNDDTLTELVEWHERIGAIKVISLSRNFGKERALAAALDYASGDAVIPIDADLQDPPELIPQMIELWKAGYDVVNAIRSNRRDDKPLKRITARLFYRAINKVSEVEITPDAGDFRLLSRRVCDVLRTMRERHRFMKGLFAWVGFPTTQIYFERPHRVAGDSKWSYWKLWNYAIEGITSLSTVPLKLASYLGLLTAGISFVYALVLIAKTLIYGEAVKGYPSLMTAILFFGGVQLIFIGVVGEYIARIHDEVKIRPIYVIDTLYGLEKSNEK